MNLYVLKHTNDETDLCMLEKKCLFNNVSDKNYFLVKDYIDINRSPYAKYCLKDITFGDSLQDLIKIIMENNISYDNFKVKYLDIEGDVEFDKRHEIERLIGYDITGFSRVGTPEVIIGVTVLGGKWMFGEYLKNNADWLAHTKRPQEYCNALTTKVSRAIVNIAVGNNTNSKLIDPCCGIGTIVIEALSMGLNIVGMDINEKIARGAMKNIDYFDFPEVVEVGNIHDIIQHYDIVFIDLPYGILSISSKLNQLEIIKSAKRIGDLLALVSVEDFSQELVDMGFKIIERCVIAKGNFKRQFYLCKS